MSKNRITNSISLCINILIIALVCYSISTFFSPNYYEAIGNMNIGTQAFRYYTNLSNMLCGLMCGITIYFNIKNIIKDTNYFPAWSFICKLVGTVGVTLTFLTVVFFLGPTQGWTIMFADGCLYLHLINPLLAIITFIFLDSSKPIKFKYTPIGISSMLIYGIIYMICVIGTKVWPDFYGFNSGILENLWPISFIVMIIATYGISVLLWFLNKKCNQLPYNK